MFTREIAYTWFNRLAALRYMEIHDYFDHGFRVLSPAKSHLSNADSLPEILNHASDVAESLNLDKDHIIELQLAGDKEEELYRELLLGQCHQLAKIMPQIFKGLAFGAIDDATELLLPNNLTKTDSILKGLINDIPEEDWVNSETGKGNIEVIGWLYQFYISEHKDSVIGKVVKSEDIPAATQLFTPNWIVKYLVQNSVGRQWLATYPESELKGKMEYYIEPAEQSQEVVEQLKAITPTSIDPEEIKVLDPACGSGHILVEVYEVLREIYLERGYRLREIPELILTKNIYGLDIDDRAAQLAGFALMMKAREDDRRIFQRVEEGEVALNVFSLQSTEHLDIPKLWQALDLEGNQQTGSTGGLFDTNDQFIQTTGIYKKYFELLQSLKSAFLQAKTLGSLIQIEHKYLDHLIALKVELDKKLNGSDPSAKLAASSLLPIVNQAIPLAIKYAVVVANPPYMGMKGMNSELKDFAKEYYKKSKSDLFSIYIEKCLEFTKFDGEIAMVTPYVWMFIGSFELLRKEIIANNTLSSLVQLEYNAFAPACIPVCAYTIRKQQVKGFISSFIRLSEFKGSENQAPKTLEAINNNGCSWFYQTQPASFSAMPSYVFGYWLHENILLAFSDKQNIGSKGNVFEGLKTRDNDRFVRHWYEISNHDTKWVNYSKGGGFRRWYGNNLYSLKWSDELKNFKKASGVNYKYFNQATVTYSTLSSSRFSCRYIEGGFFGGGGGGITCLDKPHSALALLNSTVLNEIFSATSPTLNFEVGAVSSMPLLGSEDVLDKLGRRAVDISKFDWDSSELSFEFKSNSLIRCLSVTEASMLSKCFEHLLDANDRLTNELLDVEKSIDAEVASALNIDSELFIQKSIKDMSLACNNLFEYGEEAKDRSRSDLLCELISFCIGTMMGRFSLDREGLVYAHSANEGFKELEAGGAYKTFPADDDGIIPLASEEWLFDDDATTRFKEFVKTVWGDEHLSENLEFVAESLCLHALKPLSTKKGSSESAMDTIRRYFSTQFFKDHCKTYKKRPIYWLFSSGKEKAFECLVYLHRYNESTLSRMRTEYVTPLMGKYEAQHTLLSEQQLQATGTESRGIEKDLKSLEKKQAELRTFDEQLKHYAEMRITLDLDDGVKANYGKFGNLLADVKAIHGKAVK